MKIGKSFLRYNTERGAIMETVTLLKRGFSSRDIRRKLAARKRNQIIRSVWQWYGWEETLESIAPDYREKAKAFADRVIRESIRITNRIKNNAAYKLAQAA